jgi:hypothetical protein
VPLETKAFLSVKFVWPLAVSATSSEVVVRCSPDRLLTEPHLVSFAER